MLRYIAVLDDGLLDVSYVMNYPREQVPNLLRELMRGREESDTLEIMDCFGSMRVKWLEVHCADGLQASFCGACAPACVSPVLWGRSIVEKLRICVNCTRCA